MKSNPIQHFLFAITCLVLLQGAGSLRAAESTIRFRTLSWQGDISGLYFQGVGGEGKELDAKDYVRSLPCHASANSDLVFFELEKNEAGETVRKEAGRIPAGHLQDDLLVIITPTPEGYRFSSFPEDSTSFPPNTYRFLNASKSELAVRVGTKVERVAPGASATMKTELSPAESGVPVQIGKFEINTQGGVLVYSNRLAVREGQRTLIIATDSGNSNQPIQTKRIVESTRANAAQGGKIP